MYSVFEPWNTYKGKSQYFRIRKEMFQLKEQVYSASMNQNVSDCEFEKITDKENSKANLKVR